MTQLLRPSTDAGVIVQAVVVALLLGVGLWSSRRRPELRLLVVGLGVLSFALMGLRAAH